VRETPRIEIGHSREVVDITRVGTWQGTSLAQYDGPREREIIVGLR
jgi:thiamine phosphate synthase YjbQ (UPF0047 family)